METEKRTAHDRVVLFYVKPDKKHQAYALHGSGCGTCCRGSSSGIILLLGQVIKFLHDCIIGFLADIRQLAAPGFLSLLVALFKCGTHFL